MLFKHDCNKCISLGEFNKHDLYFCVQLDIIPTVIARYGNEPWEYNSGLYNNTSELKEARLRALNKNLINEDNTIRKINNVQNI